MNLYAQAFSKTTYRTKPFTTIKVVEVVFHRIGTAVEWASMLRFHWLQWNLMNLNPEPVVEQKVAVTV
jgi:hypothetical protein